MNDKIEPTDPKRVVEQSYDKVAEEYALLEGETEWPRMKWLWRLLALLEAGSTVLDLGCGSGDPADIEISKEHIVTGVDISQAQIDLARKNVPAATFIHGDAASIHFPPLSFNAVVSFYAIEHVPQKEHASTLGRIYGWLRSGGYLLISMEAGEANDVMGEWLGVPMFFSYFEPETTRALMEDAGFEILDTGIETQIEQGTEIPYLWVLAHKG